MKAKKNLTTAELAKLIESGYCTRSDTDCLKLTKTLLDSSFAELTSSYGHPIFLIKNSNIGICFDLSLGLKTLDSPRWVSLFDKVYYYNKLSIVDLLATDNKDFRSFVLFNLQLLEKVT